MSKPVYDNDQIISQLQYDGDPRRWYDATVEYLLPTRSPSNDPRGGSNFVQMNARQEALAHQAFELWDDLIAISIVEEDNPDARQSDITMALSSNFAGEAEADTDANPFLFGPKRISDSDIWLGDQREGLGATDYLDYGQMGYRSMVHEVGHALGLYHPGPYNGSGDYGPDAVYAQDTRQYTIMSYFNAGLDGSGADHSEGHDGSLRDADQVWGSTPLLHDIMAIQALYGADMKTRTGNDTYGYNASFSNRPREAFDFTKNTKPVVAIWDAGGIDTIDVSGHHDSGQVVDLQAGHFSSVLGMKKNLAIAHGAVIENAIGGGGSDRLIGNAANNRLVGNDGHDVLHGHRGHDRLYAGNGDDYVYGEDGDDRLDGGTGKDRLESGKGIDTLIGGSGTDKLIAGEGDDRLDGGSGTDTLYGEDGNDTLIGGRDTDVLIGGDGHDTYYVDTAAGPAQNPTTIARLVLTASAAATVPGDQVFEGAGQGTDLVYSTFSYTLGRNVEKLVLVGSQSLKGTGNELANALTGNAGANVLSGVNGNDGLKGMGGNDTLVGGRGRDVMDGGTGRDIFDFNAASESAVGTMRDMILNFRRAEGDRIDLSSIDAGSAKGNNAFTFIGREEFDDYRADHSGAAGLVRQKGTIIQVDIGANGSVDMEISVSGLELRASDFIL